MRFRATVADLVLAALVLAAPVASAHNAEVSRTLMLEPRADGGLEILVVLRVPSGRHRAALELLAGTDPVALETHLGARALDGLGIRSGTVALALSDPETKIRVAPRGGPIEVALHLRSARGGEAGAAIAVSTGLVGDPLELLVISGPRALGEVRRGRRTPGGLSVGMGLGDRVRFRLE